jgi:MoaA/NifB/PqqE/SkfB family radical SAM enzyme
VAADCAHSGIPYAAFGGGEPLAVPHVWDVFETLSSGGTAIKIETDGLRIDEAAADRLKGLSVECVQVSVDGAGAAAHERVRPGGDFAGACAAIERLASRGVPAEFVFAPCRPNIAELADAYDLAVSLGARAFVTGPLMRLGRAALSWDSLALPPEDWRGAVERLEERALSRGGPIRLSVYPWDILEEARVRLESPQAMLLVVPDGKVKLLNALPFACADLKRGTLAEAWEAYKTAWRRPEVAEFVKKLSSDPGLLRHANETWPL